MLTIATDTAQHIVNVWHITRLSLENSVLTFHLLNGEVLTFINKRLPDLNHYQAQIEQLKACRCGR